MDRLIAFVKKEAVLTIALLLALVSSFVVKPSKDYIGYIDYHVLVLLFALMLVVGGFKSLGVFRLLGEKMCSRVKSLRGLTLVLTLLCFLSSMLITNDVALITFVPFTISVFCMIACEDKLIPVIVLETIAANLGSMLTPIGNPQNLLLFSLSEMNVIHFVLHMLPLTLLSLILILICVVSLKSRRIQITQESDAQQGRVLKDYRFWVYMFLFLVCMGNVFHLYSYWVVLGVVAVVVLVLNRALYAEVDYSLLLTFVGFFIFIGNMKQIDSVNQLLMQVISGNELLMGIVASQIISNVPAAMLLSGFTSEYGLLLYGVNIGGLGTLIASMASLISYRFFVKEYPEQKAGYFRHFTAYNVVLLVIITVTTMLVL